MPGGVNRKNAGDGTNESRIRGAGGRVVELDWHYPGGVLEWKKVRPDEP